MKNYQKFLEKITLEDPYGEENWDEKSIYEIPLYLSDDQPKVYQDGTPLQRPWIGKNLVLFEKNDKYYILGEIRYSGSGFFMFYEYYKEIESKRLRQYVGGIKRELIKEEKEKVVQALSSNFIMKRNPRDHDNFLHYTDIINNLINERITIEDPYGEEDWLEDTDYHVGDTLLCNLELIVGNIAFFVGKKYKILDIKGDYIFIGTVKGKNYIPFPRNRVIRHFIKDNDEKKFEDLVIDHPMNKIQKFSEYRKGSAEYGQLFQDLMMLLRLKKEEDKEATDIILNRKDLKNIDFDKLMKLVSSKKKMRKLGMSFDIEILDGDHIRFFNLNSNKESRPWENKENIDPYGEENWENDSNVNISDYWDGNHVNQELHDQWAREREKKRIEMMKTIINASSEELKSRLFKDWDIEELAKLDVMMIVDILRQYKGIVPMKKR